MRKLSELIELSVKYWGETPQLLKTIEELAELQRCIARYLIIESDEKIVNDAQHWNTDLQLTEMCFEIADVEIMIAQIKKHFNRPAIYAHALDVKTQNLERLIKLEEMSL